MILQEFKLLDNQGIDSQREYLENYARRYNAGLPQHLQFNYITLYRHTSGIFRIVGHQGGDIPKRYKNNTRDNQSITYKNNKEA